MSETQSQRVVPPSRRRDKPILSCSLCRRRKLKCDRQQPCRTCIDRGLSLSCTYNRVASSPKSGQLKAPINVHDRIDQLEKLVTSLMGAKSGEHGSPNMNILNLGQLQPGSDQSADAEIPGTPDRVKLENDATSYTSSGHWSSILDGIVELRDHLDDPSMSGAQPRDSAQSEIQGPDLLFGRHRHATRNEILAAIPKRTEADELLMIYFSSMDLTPTLIHKPTFLKEYGEFWNRPRDTPIMWLGLLFTMFCVATRVMDILENEGDGPYGLHESSLCSARMDFYREKIVQCLILADYSKCPPYTAETMILYFVAEYFRSQDSQFGTWILAGMIVRIAFRMGYHREPSRFPNITPFKAEMRRRIWTMIVQLDLMSSSQVGLPRMIQKSMHDTEEPRNLLDDDLDENMTELPPARPDSESTVMAYALIRNRILDVFARIMDLANSMKQPAYQTLMELDDALKTVYEKIPPGMQAVCARDVGFTDSDADMRRLSLGLAFLRAKLMLHRPYLILGRTDSRYEYSRLSCIDAALEILEFQRTLDKEWRPSGKFWSFRWRFLAVNWRLSSLVNHDFLLATTVLSLDLDKDLTSPIMNTTDTNAEFSNSRPRFTSQRPTRAEVVEALSGAYYIWTQVSQKSREARKVATAVEIILRKANADIGSTNQDSTPPQGENSHKNNDFAQIFQDSRQQAWQQLPADTPTFFGNTNPGFSPSSPDLNLNAPMDFGSMFNWVSDSKSCANQFTLSLAFYRTV
ncbi:hypothetical protein K469DRAFT_665085 [Zopfia rhizophila CBS 207.26]|uniref:Zn(2)-C6 fungal-type domain-containing protein n=1 Tax=Zopfia rhizophila CBS 207.26 TaxID=1314779 RepID=A0A6A6E2P4_9PEZI|nr:hypothetical protein K469DRAFT_665085 [Zopfia rhizophila CBS 207.26]